MNSLTICPVCGNPATKFNISRVNVDFLLDRSLDRTIDQAIGLSSIAWDSFPSLRLSSDSQVVINSLITSIQQQVTKVLLPLEVAAKMTVPLQNRLDGMVEKLPMDFKKEFSQISEQIDERLKSIERLAESSNQPIEQQLKELFQFINLLTNKPIVKGSIGEEAIALAWPEAFPRDRICKKGGSGEVDLLIFPTIEACGFQVGQRIAIERKTGSQKYQAVHLYEVSRHSKKEGSKYSLLIYDGPENLLEAQKPLSVLTFDETIVGICEMRNGTWRTMRQLFGVLQSVQPNNEVSASSLNAAEMRKTIEQMNNINLQIDSLRKNNNLALCGCQKVQNNICERRKNRYPLRGTTKRTLKTKK